MFRDVTRDSFFPDGRNADPLHPSRGLRVSGSPGVWIALADATGPTQLALGKAFNAAGFPGSPDLRVEYNPNMKYTTGVWTLPDHVRANWPVPRGGYNIGVFLTMTPDVEAGESRAFYLETMEKNQIKFVEPRDGSSGVLTLHSVAHDRRLERPQGSSSHGRNTSLYPVPRRERTSTRMGADAV